MEKVIRLVERVAAGAIFRLVSRKARGKYSGIDNKKGQEESMKKEPKYVRSTSFTYAGTDFYLETGLFQSEVVGACESTCLMS